MVRVCWGRGYVQNLCTFCCEPNIALKIKEREGEKRKEERRRGEGKGEEARVELGHRGRKGARGTWPSQEEQEREAL